LITDIIAAFKQVRPADKTAKTEMLNYKDILKKIKPPKKKPRVWLLEKEKIGYIRLRKVASSSINRCLTQHIVNSTDQQDVVIDWALVKATEERYSSHIEHSVIRRDLKGKYFLFAFVRNPLGRVWSCYKNKIINPRRAGKKDVLANGGFYYGMDFTEFVDVLVKLPDNIIDRHLRSQSWFLRDEQGLLPDYIGKLENFDADWNFISSKYSLPKPIHHNKTSNSVKITDICPRASLEKLIDGYADDIKLFGYQQAVDDTLKEYQTEDCQ
jgi:hypothetical protein